MDHPEAMADRIADVDGEVAIIEADIAAGKGGHETMETASATFSISSQLRLGGEEKGRG